MNARIGNLQMTKPHFNRTPFVVAIMAMQIAFASAAAAHGPTPQKVDEVISVTVPPAAAWALVKKFADISAWHPGVATSQGQVDKDAGETRTIKLKSGGELVEGLDYTTEEEMKIGWRLSKENVDAFPVSSYSSSIAVTAADGGSEVRWVARLYRADTGNEPPPGKDDATAVQVTTDFVKQGLEGLKAKLEGK